MATPRRNKAKRKSKSSSDADIEDDGGLQLFSSRTIAKAQTKASIKPASSTMLSSHPEPNEHMENVDAPQKEVKSRFQQQTEARSDLKSILDAIKSSCTSCIEQVKALRSQIEDGRLETQNGVSFLDVKQQLLMSYNMNLILIIIRKLRGGSLASSTATKRLIRLRLLLEKLKPIDKKLQYQIDKLVKLASSNAIAQGSQDALQLRPNPNDLVPKDGQGDDDDSDDETALQQQRDAGMQASGVYQPPRLAAVPYHEAESAALKRDRQERRQKRQLLASSMLKELRDEVSDRPMEIREQDESGADKLRSKRFKADAKDKLRYEEENFVRLASGKKDKKRRNPRSELHDLVEFGSFKGYSDDSVVNSSNRKSIRDQMKEVERPQTRTKRLRAKRGGKK
eukprot:TRINITY_DN10283_c0_g2_i4.p1 TRINITY_DN10283_c0_g2~~TRINITY_DN10283_c0_g2_i4.p1  ORF type:complete len:396 (+),score=117.50 TRINITY_DN10283_c0_g2_i4:21-1208(+)